MFKGDQQQSKGGKKLVVMNKNKSRQLNLPINENEGKYLNGSVSYINLLLIELSPHFYKSDENFFPNFKK